MDEENALRADIQNLLVSTAKSFLPNQLVDEVFQLARNVVTKTTRKGSADFACKAFVCLFANMKRIATNERGKGSEDDEEVEEEEEDEGAIREALLKSTKVKTTNNEPTRKHVSVLEGIFHLRYRRKARDPKDVTLILYRVTEYGLIQRNEYSDSIALSDAVYEHMDASQIYKAGIADVRTCPKSGTMRILSKKRLAEHAKMGS